MDMMTFISMIKLKSIYRRRKKVREGNERKKSLCIVIKNQNK